MWSISWIASDGFTAQKELGLLKIVLAILNDDFTIHFYQDSSL